MELTSNQVCIDIETLPGSERPEINPEELEDLILAAVPKKYKKQESINTFAEEHREELIDSITDGLEADWRKEALDPLRGKIYCIGYTFGEEDVRCSMENTEYDTLVFFSAHLESRYNSHLIPFHFYGHNYAGFDGPFLWKRALKYGLTYLASVTRPGKWGKRCEDTMTMFGDGDNHFHISMDNLAQFLGLGSGKEELPSEYCDILDLEHGTELNGSLVLDLVEAGLGDVVVEYCKKDVAVTREIYRKLKSVIG